MEQVNPNSRRFRMELGGQWEIDDLEELVESLRTSYAYFYWAMLDPDSVDEATKSLIVRHFWSQRWQLEQTASELYRRIPEPARLQLASIHYASPGWIELAWSACWGFPSAHLRVLAMVTSLQQARARLRVLVVDENEDLRSSLSILLELAGCHPVGTGGTDAMSSFALFRPAVVLTELRLNGADGFTLCRRIRQMAGPAPLILAHTGWMTPRLRHELHTAGFDRLFLKPAEPAELLDLIASRGLSAPV